MGLFRDQLPGLQMTLLTDILWFIESGREFIKKKSRLSKKDGCYGRRIAKRKQLGNT